MSKGVQSTRKGTSATGIYKADGVYGLGGMYTGEDTYEEIHLIAYNSSRGALQARQ